MNKALRWEKEKTNHRRRGAAQPTSRTTTHQASTNQSFCLHRNGQLESNSTGAKVSTHYIPDHSKSPEPGTRGFRKMCSSYPNLSCSTCTARNHKEQYVRYNREGCSPVSDPCQSNNVSMVRCPMRNFLPVYDVKVMEVFQSQ